MGRKSEVKVIFKILTLSVLALSLIACEEQQNAAGSRLPSEDLVLPVQPDVQELPNEGTLYVLDGSTHPTLFGDIWEFGDGTYRRMVWDNGVYYIEEGTYETEQVLEDNDHAGAWHDYMYLQPTSFSPSNCGYSLDEIRHDYEALDNGSNPAQSLNFDFGDTRLTDVGNSWPNDMNYVTTNLTLGCI